MIVFNCVVSFCTFFRGLTWFFQILLLFVNWVLFCGFLGDGRKACTFFRLTWFLHFSMGILLCLVSNMSFQDEFRMTNSIN
jgi:hypothetical protein